MSKQIPFEMVLEKAYQYKAEMSQFPARHDRHPERELQ